MIKARDIMKDTVVSVTKNSSLYEAATLISINDITGIPVVDEDMKLIGVVTEKDILDLYDVMQYAESRTVNSSMSHDVVSFDVNDELEEVCRCLKNENFRRVPVTENGILVGIISRRDLILHMLKVRRKNDKTAL